MDRPYVARELIPYGSPASADLLNALDRRIQDRQLPSDCDRADGPAHERRRRSCCATTCSSSATGCCARSSSGGCSRPLPRARPAHGASGDAGVQRSRRCTRSRTSKRSRRTPAADTAAAGRRLPVDEPDGDRAGRAAAGSPSSWRATATASSTLASAGLLGPRSARALLGRVRRRRPRCGRRCSAGSALVVTDSNRRRARRWSTVTDTVGYTEGPGNHPLETTRPTRASTCSRRPVERVHDRVRLEGAKARSARRATGTRSPTHPEDRAARARSTATVQPRGGPARSTTCSGEQDPRRASTSRSPPTTSTSCRRSRPPNERYITQRGPAVRRRRPDARRARRSVAHRATARPSASRVGPSGPSSIEVRDTNLGQLRNYGGVEPGRLRRDPPPGHGQPRDRSRFARSRCSRPTSRTRSGRTPQASTDVHRCGASGSSRSRPAATPSWR